MTPSAVAPLTSAPATNPAATAPVVTGPVASVHTPKALVAVQPPTPATVGQGEYWLSAANGLGGYSYYYSGESTASYYADLSAYYANLYAQAAARTTGAQAAGDWYEAYLYGTDAQYWAYQDYLGTGNVYSLYLTTNATYGQEYAYANAVYYNTPYYVNV